MYPCRTQISINDNVLMNNFTFIFTFLKKILNENEWIKKNENKKLKCHSHFNILLPKIIMFAASCVTFLIFRLK